MTNFEKWREGLTVDDFIQYHYGTCGRCPSDIGCSEELPCIEAIKQWANQEAGEG
jgi:hypothetical protein